MVANSGSVRHRFHMPEIQKHTALVTENQTNFLVGLGSYRTNHQPKIAEIKKLHPSIKLSEKRERMSCLTTREGKLML